MDIYAGHINDVNKLLLDNKTKNSICKINHLSEITLYQCYMSNSSLKKSIKF